MKFYTAIITVLLAFAFLGCSAPATKTSEEKTDGAKTENTEEKTDAKDSDEAKTETETAEAANMSSPKETITTFVTAIQKKDGALIKKCLSKGSIAQFEKDSKDSKKSIEDLLIETFEDEEMQKIPEMKNEKIDGDTATLDVKDEEIDKWDSIPFVKEDGVWKIAFDKVNV